MEAMAAETGTQAIERAAVVRERQAHRALPASGFAGSESDRSGQIVRGHPEGMSLRAAAQRNRDPGGQK